MSAASLRWWVKDTELVSGTSSSFPGDRNKCLLLPRHYPLLHSTGGRASKKQRESGGTATTMGAHQHSEALHCWGQVNSNAWPLHSIFHPDLRTL